MNILNWKPKKYSRSCSSNEKVFDGRTNDIKEEKTWNEHRNVLQDKKSYNIKIPSSHVPTKTKFLEQKRLAIINNLEKKFLFK